jgi:AraC-like DNA-binding protein
MNEAISLMHDDPAHHWTVTELAKCAGLSRSVFALKFKQAVGKTPMEYLTLWRMMLAGDKLKNSNDSISVIALSLGYESQSSFTRAFKKAMGCSPRKYCQAPTCDANLEKVL